MNCKNCGYGLKQRCGDFEKIICTYEEGECVKITELEKQLEKEEEVKQEQRIKELEAQIEKMRNCGNCVNICNGRRNDRCIGCMKSKNFPHWEWDKGE